MLKQTQSKQANGSGRRTTAIGGGEKNNESCSASRVRVPLGTVIGNRGMMRALSQLASAAKASTSTEPHNDMFEREADKAASHVMSNTSSNSNAIGARNSADSPPIAESRHPLAKGGKALDRETLDFFEHRYGRRFSDVRIHNDSAAADSAQGLQAKAFTVGNRIYFGRGEYEPRTREGKTLLAHELAHVAQQTGTHGGFRNGGLASSLTRTSRPTIQRKLVAAGDTARFLTVVNSLMTVFQRVAVSATGEVTLVSNPNQGPPDREQQGVLNALSTIINDAATTTVEFIRGRTSTVAAHRSVLIGAYGTGQIDLDDISALGSGLGGTTTATALVHELIEQYRKQVHGEAYGVAHPAGERAEEGISGAIRGTHSVRPINASTVEVTVPWTYPDGRIIDVVMTITDGNVMAVRRNLRP